MSTMKAAVALGAALALGGGTVAAATDDGDRDRDDDRGKRSASATIRSAEGERLGKVWFHQRGDAVRVEIRGEDMPPGFHGLHLHAIARCEPPGFATAGPHWTTGDKLHPEHTGDLPVLYVQGEGDARLITYTDRFTVRELLDDDGTALLVHANPDNYANVPERYAPDGPDAETRMAGDSGARVACAEVGD
jgi:Cu-Zn family superoxide dismutase